MWKFFNIYYWIYIYVYFKSSRLIERKRYNDAIKLMISVLEKKKFATEAIYYKLGIAYFEIENYKLAKESFFLSIENNLCEDIYKANSYYYLGLTYYELKEFKEALLNFQKAIDIKKNLKLARDSVISLAHLYCYLGRSYVRLDKPEKAFKIFNEGLKFEPDNKALQRELTLLGVG